MPEARLDVGALLVVLRVLLRELRDDRLDAPVDAQQRLHLPRTRVLASAWKSRDQLERFLLQTGGVDSRQLADPARCIARA